MNALAPVIAVALMTGLSPAVAAPPQSESGSGDKITHPAEVAYVKESERGYVYRRFPTGERLYTYDRDPMGHSVCNRGCDSAWPPVIAPADAAAVGDWTIVARYDGTRQWALKGKPVYMRFHDAPEIASGDGMDGVWHVIGYTPAPVEPIVNASAHDR